MPDDNPPRHLTLPPRFAAHPLAAGEAAAEAVARAETEGAGTLIWAWRPDAGPGRLDFAVVLEPDDPLDLSRKAFHAGLCALAEALASHIAPERAVTLTPRGEVRVDGGRVGGLRLIAPDCAESETPPWLVLAAELIADRSHLEHTGRFPESTSLAEQGVLDPPAVVESFCAHLMLAFDRWRHEGFSWIAGKVAARLDAGRIGDAGEWQNGPARISLPALLRDPPWRDASGPRL